ncbi:Ig-like domain-containing protein [Paenibacillus spongiae]|uniref:Bacterial Ig domain-containing protein n=1 Tax=Paenibacillus spongiae TaxID=2909671 RepID=A0ABY5S8C7_9BACL|nr:Ig-like domain-containing protein [Paenibacillus spongiae]UVI28785.1 hypothetical protein L1F29_25585 [Paenibacillus spongiae]
MDHAFEAGCHRQPICFFAQYCQIKRNGKERSLFGASEAQIKVKDSTGTLVGLGTADKQGDFSIDVERDEFYELEISF